MKNSAPLPYTNVDSSIVRHLKMMSRATLKIDTTVILGRVREMFYQWFVDKVWDLELVSYLRRKL